ncbi:MULTISPECIES: DMT family transporter [Streptomyces]|uniref:Putative integral membrane protein n=1 Tax=Streptomyces venezuelae (strain ATCC 10712 / CBS 650.69 / DSM 40230 / JCM 4526 / NBRC 13096 / PD 04745) TaxID=953739 RepID=F2R7I8_STRVP|nr:DMT family transporter [Streptomyces venezuelae]APE22141.1 EamA family transporter [Streptomyces venezuelae]QER99527.1 EamA family transporter [Streptomyces venezuelae ATCC 10712]QES14709.1 EamA family transporter [Streptomyces venezuelae]CCA56273.1 putative integral membrane protein [Streptomyces venezuelae ATCC 10712]
MTPLVTLAVLTAAVTHASWNALAHHIKDQLLSFTLICGGSVLIALVAALFVPLPAAGAWPYLVASALLHVAYMALLMRSFTLGDFGQMYPIARGTAPLVVTALAAVFLDEVPDGGQLLGVAVACAGLTGLAVWGIRGKGARPHWPALLAAGATGLSIALYTVVDGVGVRASGSPLGYIAWLMILQGLAIPGYALWTRRGALPRQLRPYAGRGLLGAALSLSAYSLVLWAQTKAPLAPVAALRESSIIVGAAIGAVLFKERFGGPRIAAAGLMAAGIGLMLYGG